MLLLEKKKKEYQQVQEEVKRKKKRILHFMMINQDIIQVVKCMKNQNKTPCGSIKCVFRNNYCDFSKIYFSFNSRFRYMLSEQFDLEYHFYGIAFFLAQYRQFGCLQELPINMIENIFSFLSETPFNNVHTETKHLSKKKYIDAAASKYTF